jgi:hypothetical protein
MKVCAAPVICQRTPRRVHLRMISCLTLDCNKSLLQLRNGILINHQQTLTHMIFSTPITIIRQLNTPLVSF